jgi:heme/copper-type cytochrome/quinol oxidase subunit 2
MLIVAMVVFLLLRCLTVLLGQAAMLAAAKKTSDQNWAIAGMIMTGLAAVCIVYLAVN